MTIETGNSLLSDDGAADSAGSAGDGVDFIVKMWGRGVTFGKRGIVGRVLIGDISNSGPSVHVTTIVELTL